MVTRSKRHRKSSTYVVILFVLYASSDLNNIEFVQKTQTQYVVSIKRVFFADFINHRMVKSTSEREQEHKQRLLEGLWQFYQDGQLTDITLVVDGREFKCNKNVLAASSPYFRLLLQLY